jgi:hypothetical protein
MTDQRDQLGVENTHSTTPDLVAEWSCKKKVSELMSASRWILLGGR